MAEGERSTKYFFSLEKARYNSKTCYKIINENGQEFSNSQDILNEQRKFYTKLYSQDEDVEFNLTNKTGIIVPKNIQDQQDYQLCLEDLESAIKKMNNNKTPGEDGIPIDFYKVFWNRLKRPFLNMMLESYSKGLLHQTARQGILNLIPKPQKDSRLIKNLRPITLLNTDYKIIEKAVADKMLPALEHIINKDQRGFMKDRRISVNIRKMLDITQEAERDDLEAVVLSLDFVKCFDKCSFSILHGSLDYFQFGKIIKDWTQILYKDFTVKIQNNGNFSESIEIKKGVHQGGCCSSIYFLVIAEILAMALRANDDIEGITVKDIKNLLNQFADDMDIFSLCKEKSIKAIKEELEKFRLQSGFTVSYEKTTLYRIGSLRHSSAMMYNIDQFTWSNRDINVLGVTISHSDGVEKNYQGIIEKARKILFAWQNRSLSLIGKVQVVNTMIASLFVYKMMVLPEIPKNIIKNMDNLIREFLWNGKKSKIAYNILQNTKEEGGLNLVNLRNKDKALKATWPKILSQEEEYAKLVYKIMRCSALGDDIWRCRLKPQDVPILKIRNPFWENVLQDWSEYNYYIDTRIENQLLWYNSNIKIQGKPFLWTDILSNGLKYVHQLFRECTFKSFENIQEEFGLSKLRYNSLKMAIPQDWKNFFQQKHKEEYLPIPPHTFDNLTRGGIANFSQKVYKFLGDDTLLIHRKYIKWREDLGDEYDDTLIEFRDEHKNIYQVTNVAKYRSFQYRLLQRALVTNINLHKWGLEGSDLCFFCNEERETIMHLMSSCSEVSLLWQQVKIWIEENFKTQIDLNPTKIIFNRLVQPKKHIANFICLLTKQYIYRQKCLKKPLHFQSLKAHLWKIENLEKYISIQRNRLSIHQLKWKREEKQSQPQTDQTHSLRNYILEYNDNI